MNLTVTLTAEEEEVVMVSPVAVTAVSPVSGWSRLVAGGAVMGRTSSILISGPGNTLNA